MAVDNIEAEVKKIIEEKLGKNAEQITNDASFLGELGADSLDQVELVMEFEEKFKIDIPDEDAEKMRTVGEAINYLKERLNA